MPRRLRILHVVPYFPPDRIGGVGQVVAHLHRALLQQGHKSEVVTAGHSQDDPTVHRIARTPAGWALAVTGAARRTREFGVVHCHAGEALCLAISMRLLRAQAPLLVTYHVGYAGVADALRPFTLEGVKYGRTLANWRYRNLTARVHRVADTMMLRLATGINFISQSGAREVLGAERAASARVIYNGVPASPVGEPASHAAPVDLLYVGTGGLRKRLHLLPYVIRDIRKELPDARVRLVGLEPSQDPALERLIRQLGLVDAFQWSGILRSEEITPHYRAARVLVVPSAYEGLPMVILEALANGTPCVATKVSGHPEVIRNGLNGFLCKPDDPGDMAQCCLKILRNPQLARAMGARAVQTIENQFTLERQVREYIQLYEALIDIRALPADRPSPSH